MSPEEVLAVGVPDDDLDFDEELIYTYRGQLFTGVAYEETPDGVLSAVSYRDGAQEGPACDWYPSRRLMCKTTYHQNARHGPERKFDESGNLVEETEWEFGIRVSSISRDATGRVLGSQSVDTGDPSYQLLQEMRAEHPTES